MINTLGRNIAQASARVKWAPRFSERRLLLIAGDIAFMVVSGLAAVWIHSML